MPSKSPNQGSAIGDQTFPRIFPGRSSALSCDALPQAGPLARIIKDSDAVDEVMDNSGFLATAPFRDMDMKRKAKKIDFKACTEVENIPNLLSRAILR